MMQTFVPFCDVDRVARCLDDKRLYKQVVECKQILNALRAKRHGEKYGYQNHPATLMWEGYDRALKYYQMVLLNEWCARRWDVKLRGDWLTAFNEVPKPFWWGDLSLHMSHRANLYRKDPEHYAAFKRDSYKWPGSYIWPVISKKDIED